MNLDDIKLQEKLTDKQLAIFNAEMARQQRSLTVGYLLLVFLGALGLHKFYIGRILAGIVYALLFILGWAFMGSGGLVAIFGSAEDVAAASGMSFIGMFMLIVLGFCLLWDLITLSRQFAARESKIRHELLQRFGVENSEQANSCSSCSRELGQADGGSATATTTTNT